jgi:2-polyprenyl-3-methyl-5-hydroxy-6-metoxy-1,4-benzoquinol methylase
MANPEKFWDFLSKNFDQNEGNPAEREDIKITKKYLHPSDVVLDYACGTGTLSIEIADQVKEIRAVDISSKMLAAAERKATERKIENIYFEHTTIFDERYPKESFDAVMAFNILHLLENAQQAVQRINELLKPGGFFISNTPCLGEKRSLLNSLLSPLFMVPSKMGIIPYVKVFKISELEDILARGNFQMVETKKFVGGISEYFIVTRKIDRR